MSTRRYCPVRMKASATCIALTTELHAFLTSMTGASTPSLAATMWLVAGSMRSWLAEAKSTSSTSPGDSASASRAAATARSEASHPSGRTCTVSTPVMRRMSPVGSRTSRLRPRNSASVSAVVRTRSGRWMPSPATRAEAGEGTDASLPSAHAAPARSALPGHLEVEHPGDAEAVLQHAVERRPSGRSERHDDRGTLGQLLPVAGEFVGIGAAHRHEERDDPGLPRGATGNVVGHHAEAGLGGHLPPHDLLGLCRVGDGSRVDVAHERQLPAEDGLVELERGARVSAEVEVGRGGDGHRDLLLGDAGLACPTLRVIQVSSRPLLAVLSEHGRHDLAHAAPALAAA